MEETLARPRPMPAHFFVGVALAGFFWFASWNHLGVLGEYAFFPQWLGYILAVDALVCWRTGSSLWSSRRREFVGLFLFSAPVWWLFEGMNNFILNWHYQDMEPFAVGRALLMGSIDFSTVVPAVFETTALLSTFSFVTRRRNLRRVAVSPGMAWALMYVGAAAFAAVVLLPHLAFPLAWLWIVLLADPLNYLRGRDSLLGQISRGDWRLVIALAGATLVCGLFWEMWNYGAMPKWYYTVPFVGFLKVFEMPLLGYGGYVPFGWELYAIYQLVWGVLRRPATELKLDPVPTS